LISEGGRGHSLLHEGADLYDRGCDAMNVLPAHRAVCGADEYPGGSSHLRSSGFVRSKEDRVQQHRRSLGAILVLVGIAVIATACPVSTNGGGSGAGHAGGANSTGSTGNETGTGTGGGQDGGSNCGTHCSADLHSVLDCNGQVVTTCPPDQGCGPTGCVAACDAAAQNNSTAGCEHYAVHPDSVANAVVIGCFAAYVVNTWNGPVTIQVEYAGQMLPSDIAYVPVGTGQSITYQPLPNGQLMPGQVAILFLSQWQTPTTRPLCPVPNVGVQGTSPYPFGTGMGDAFHIITSAPVVAYDIFPYGGANSIDASATYLIPTSAWDTDYIAVDAYAFTQCLPLPCGGLHPPWPTMDFVASVDDTHVTITPTVAIVGGSGVAPAAAGTPATYVLNKGQVLQLAQEQELIGSVVHADQPIGHWGASAGAGIPVGARFGSTLHQQIPPIRALGHEYVAVRYRNRYAGQEESPPWRMVGAVDGTVLSYDPAPPMGAPLTLSRGQLAEFDASGPFMVKSQGDTHPFYMAAFMTSCDFVNPNNPNYVDCRGNAAFVDVTAPQQYRSSYTFFTDPSYPETSLVLIRSKSTVGFQDVTLDCAGVVSGWAPIGSSGDYEYARVDLVTGNYAGVNGCDNGLHQISSKGLFGLAVWGWGSAATGGTTVADPNFTQDVSYSYPAR
jgi:hypothetical protein